MMRVDALGQISSVYGTKRRPNIQRVMGSYGTDQLSISEFGKDYQVARKAVAGVSDIRADLVEDMKKKYGSDDYKVNTDDFASMLMSFMK